MKTIKFKKMIDNFGEAIIEAFHVIGLFVVGATIIWSAIGEYINIMAAPSGYASLKDILLLFIYLELGAMTGIYFKTHRMPVVFLIFIAITAITRFLVIDMKSLVDQGVITVLVLVASILVLSLTALLMRYTEKKYNDSDY